MLHLEEVCRLASIPAPVSINDTQTGISDQIASSVKFLQSDEAQRTVEVDPYWPKWNGPWWHMMLLHEVGCTHLIPHQVLERIVEALNSYFLPFFPLTIEEVPAGRDPLNHVACHCQLGCAHQLLHSAGIDVNERVPWIPKWYGKYQLQDGGLNCDEAAYTRPTPKSSMVSTLPALEAVLYCTAGELTAERTEFLDAGAQYLIRRRLYRRSGSGLPIDEDWLKLCFPRFYHYDVLRGLNFLLNWSIKLDRPLPVLAIAEVVECIDRTFPDGMINVQRSAIAGASTRFCDPATGEWSKRPAASFPLLDAVSTVGAPSLYLTDLWSKAKGNLLLLLERDLIQFD